MELPTTSLKYYIDKEIRFTKSSLESLKSNPHRRVSTEEDEVCGIFNVKYCNFFQIKENNGMYGIVMCIFKGTAENVAVNAEYAIESANISTKDNWVVADQNDHFTVIGTPDTVFDPNGTFFVADELVLKVQAILTLNFSSRIGYPIRTQWSINHSDLEALKTSTNGYLRSKRFKLSTDPDIKYFIIIYPNGSELEDRGRVQVLFAFEFGDMEKIEAALMFSIESMEICQTVSSEFKALEARGFVIASTTNLFDPENRFFIEGKLNIKVTGTVMFRKAKRPPTLMLQKGVATKKYLRHRGKEFTFVIGDKSIKVHKKVLIEASPVFAGMYESGMKETVEKKMDVIDFSYDTVDAAIKLLYSTAVPSKFTFEQVLDILRFADKYQIGIILDDVQDYLIKSISSNNVCHLINFTTTTANAPKLYSKCIEFMTECMKTRSVADLEILDKDLMAKLFMESFVHTSETDND